MDWQPDADLDICLGCGKFHSHCMSLQQKMQALILRATALTRARRYWSGLIIQTGAGWVLFNGQLWCVWRPDQPECIAMWLIAQSQDNTGVVFPNGRESSMTGVSHIHDPIDPMDCSKLSEASFLWIISCLSLYFISTVYVVNLVLNQTSFQP